MPPVLIYSTPFFLSAFLVFLIAPFGFRWRRRRGAWYMILSLLLGGVWAASEGALYLGLGLDTNLTITRLQYLAVAPLPSVVLLFVLSIFGYDRWVEPARRLLLFGMAPAVVLMVWTDPWHHWVYTRHFLIEAWPVKMLGLIHGPLWWFILGYHYLLMALSTGLLVRQAVTSSRMGRDQALILLIAEGFVWLLNAVYAFGYSPVPNMDVGPLAFILVALAMAWGFYRYNLLGVLPIAKAEIFSGLDLPILVVDNGDRILEMNPAAAAMFGIDADRAVGGALAEVLKNHPALCRLPQQADSIEVCLNLARQARFFVARISPLWRQHRQRLGRVIVLQEVTALRESERLQGVLEMAGAVCHDLSQPVMAIEGYADLMAINTGAEDPNQPLVRKIVEQARRLSAMNQRLVRITRYETRPYPGGSIVDIAKASARGRAAE